MPLHDSDMALILAHGFLGVSKQAAVMLVLACTKLMDGRLPVYIPVTGSDAKPYAKLRPVSHSQPESLRQSGNAVCILACIAGFSAQSEMMTTNWWVTQRART
jgi:hypothetical protein